MKYKKNLVCFLVLITSTCNYCTIRQEENTTKKNYKTKQIINPDKKTPKKTILERLEEKRRKNIKYKKRVIIQSNQKQQNNHLRSINDCIRERNIDALNWYLANGANPNTGKPLITAIRMFDPTSCLHLLAYGADPEKQKLGNKNLKTVTEEYKKTILRSNKKKGKIKIANLEQIEKLFSFSKNDILLTVVENRKNNIINPLAKNCTQEEIKNAKNLAYKIYNHEAVGILNRHIKTKIDFEYLKEKRKKIEKKILHQYKKLQISGIDKNDPRAISLQQKFKKNRRELIKIEKQINR